MSKQYLSGKVITPEGIVNGSVSYENGKIKEVCAGVAENDYYIAPGFVDIHCHGGGGFEFMDATEGEFEKIADFHLSHGTTSMLVTTLAASDEETEHALVTYKKHKEQSPDSIFVGVHLEGPWLNPLQCGAQNSAYMKKPIAEDIISLKEKYPFIMRVGAAPELDEGYGFGRAASERGILVSAAHTDADFSEIEEARRSGYTLMTHLYSGMKGVTRKNSFRIGGAVEAGLYFDDVYVEIIADGRHLPFELLRFIYKCKGADKICLITDAIRAAGMKNGETTVIGSLKNGLPVVVEDEVAKLLDRQSFAGSTATADRLYRTMAQALGRDMVALSKMASLTPATVMGLTDRGEIAEGKRADLLILNEELEIKKIIHGGIEK